MEDLLLNIILIIGVAACAICGSFLAIDHKLDLFGVVLMGEITAFGGGIVRDLLIGYIPVHAFSDTFFYYLELESLVVSVVIFIIATKMQKSFLHFEEELAPIVNVFDAIGLGLYVVSGTQIAMIQGFSNNGFLCVAMGTITGICGGILRDVLLGEVPFVFVKRIYALACIAGAIAYYFLAFYVNVLLATIVGLVVVVTLRILATIFHWKLPIAIKDQ